MQALIYSSNFQELISILKYTKGISAWKLHACVILKYYYYYYYHNIVRIMLLVIFIIRIFLL